MDLFVLRLAEDGPAIRNGRMRVSKINYKKLVNFNKCIWDGIRQMGSKRK